MATSRRWQRFHIGCVVFLFLILTLSHYHELLGGVPVVGELCIALSLGLSRHVMGRFIYSLLVIYSGWMLGAKWGCAILLASALAMFPRVMLVSANPRDALVESVVALVIGGLSIALVHVYRKSQQQQAALGSSQREYEELFTNASDAIWVHSLEGIIVKANEACEKLTGYAPNELIGRDVRQFLSREAFHLAGEVGSKLMLGETIGQRYEQRIIRKDKTESIAELTTRAIVVDGKTTAFQHIARDVTEERKLRDRLRIQIQKNLLAQEEERKRIARELHDDIAQSILLLSRRLDILLSTANTKLQRSVVDELEQLHSLTNEVYGSLQRYARDLRPSILDQMGLVPALAWLAEELSREMRIKAEVRAGGLPSLLPETELVMFRIAQEALSNVRRHAGASEVNIVVESSANSIRMTIEDNGSGFSVFKLPEELVREGKLGLLGMEERARLIGGTLDIQSEPGVGTTIGVTVPV